MKELSEHILDIAQNSVAAGAAHLTITLTEEDGKLTIVIADDGRGMSPELLATVLDPFTTTRATRTVGLGLSLYRMSAELTGGSLSIRSEPGQGTVVTAVFDTGHLDCPPMGDLAEVIALLIQGNPDLEVVYQHITPAGRSELFTAQLRQALGNEISLAEPAVFRWILETLSEQEVQLEGADQSQ